MDSIEGQAKPAHKVEKRNKRERSRIGVINSTFQDLRKFFPAKKAGRRMSKLEILQRTIYYIKDLTETLESDLVVSPSKLANVALPKRPRNRRTAAVRKIFSEESPETVECASPALDAHTGHAEHYDSVTCHSRSPMSQLEHSPAYNRCNFSPTYSYSTASDDSLYATPAQHNPYQYFTTEHLQSPAGMNYGNANTELNGSTCGLDNACELDYLLDWCCEQQYF